MEEKMNRKQLQPYDKNTGEYEEYDSINKNENFKELDYINEETLNFIKNSGSIEVAFFDVLNNNALHLKLDYTNHFLFRAKDRNINLARIIDILYKPDNISSKKDKSQYGEEILMTKKNYGIIINIKDKTIVTVYNDVPKFLQKRRK